MNTEDIISHRHISDKEAALLDSVTFFFFAKQPVFLSKDREEIPYL